MDVIQHGGDPQVGNLATPVNSSGFSLAFIRNLPAYRQGLSPNRRGLEIGMAHGYFIYGPFTLLGPLRNTDYANTAGLLAAVGLVAILTVALSIYASVGVSKPTETLTTPNVPEALATSEGWGEFANGFFIGGAGGAFFAYLLYQTPYIELIQQILG
ncbi:photosystem I reaction center subunit XI [Crocosphaera sp. Alani8]|uniref:photosystem I reaction center subunit XI n=1 Tax=Crocosphaera sp. Alani8 TaxID=3038952 RepID=UPI00313EBBF8